MSIILVGYRGSGKSSVGRELAEALGHDLIDIDDLIVRRAGKTIADIFAHDGEPAFRDLETAELREALLKQNHIIALGGGSIVRPINRQLIQQSGHRVIYLNCRAEELLRRIQADHGTTANRPALTALGGGLDEIKTVLSQREPHYRALADLEVDVTDLSPQDVVVQITRLL